MPIIPCIHAYKYTTYIHAFPKQYIDVCWTRRLCVRSNTVYTVKWQAFIVFFSCELSTMYIFGCLSFCFKRENVKQPTTYNAFENVYQTLCDDPNFMILFIQKKMKPNQVYLFHERKCKLFISFNFLCFFINIHIFVLTLSHQVNWFHSLYFVYLN